MKRQLTIDAAGRVIIPKPVRQRLGLKAGDALGFAVAEDQITLRPVHPGLHVAEKGNWLVVRGGPPLGVDDLNRMIKQVREDRMRTSLGETE